MHFCRDKNRRHDDSIASPGLSSERISLFEINDKLCALISCSLRF